MAQLYTNAHTQQTDPRWTTTTNRTGCTWTALTNGIDAVTHGERKPTPDRIHNLVPSWQESDPHTPGWSIPDADLAMARYGLPFRNLSGGRWEGIKFYHDKGLYLIVQGDSDQFGNNTCSGQFNGTHCIGLHPEEKRGHRAPDGGFVEDPNGEIFWRVDDPICKHARYEKPSVLRDYAEKIDVRIRFGVFSDKVPHVNDPVLRYGATALPKPTSKVLKGPPPINVRQKPTTGSSVVNTREPGGIFIAYQVTTKGELHKGSRKWWGNRRGLRWIHESEF